MPAVFLLGGRFWTWIRPFQRFQGQPKKASLLNLERKIQNYQMCWLSVHIYNILFIYIYDICIIYVIYLLSTSSWPYSSRHKGVARQRFQRATIPSCKSVFWTCVPERTCSLRVEMLSMIGQPWSNSSQNYEACMNFNKPVKFQKCVVSETLGKTVTSERSFTKVLHDFMSPRHKHNSRNGLNVRKA